MGNAITVGGPLGVQPPATEKRRFINRTGSTLAKGRVAAVDTGLSSTEAVDFRVGSSTGAFANVVFPATRVHLSSGNAILALALEAVDDNAEGEFLIVGDVPFDVTLIDSAVDTICQVGDNLYIKNGATTIDCSQAATGRCVGYAKPVVDVANVGTTDVAIYFDGRNFLGTN